MQTVSANQAKTHFGELLDTVQRVPVQVKRHDRVVGVMVSKQDYEAMRVFYADRLQQTMDRVADRAMGSGLTTEELECLLRASTSASVAG